MWIVGNVPEILLTLFSDTASRSRGALAELSAGVLFYKQESRGYA
jgi:hypothetical protein